MALLNRFWLVWPETENIEIIVAFLRSWEPIMWKSGRIVLEGQKSHNYKEASFSWPEEKNLQTSKPANIRRGFFSMSSEFLHC